VLFARKKLVKEYNDDKISSFSGDNYEFKSMIKLSSQSKENGYYDDPSNFARLAKQLLKESNFQESINLKIGSRIILTHNHLKDDDPFEFTNGELGTLIDIIIPPRSTGGDYLIDKDTYVRLPWYYEGNECL